MKKIRVKKGDMVRVLKSSEYPNQVGEYCAIVCYDADDSDLTYKVYSVEEGYDIWVNEVELQGSSVSATEHSVCECIVGDRVVVTKSYDDSSFEGMEGVIDRINHDNKTYRIVFDNTNSWWCDGVRKMGVKGKDISLVGDVEIVPTQIVKQQKAII